MDISTVVGLALASIAIVGSIVYGSPITTFIDIPSILVVFGGVIATTMIKWPAESLKTLVSVYLKSVFTTEVDPRATIDEIQRLAETARRESVFALEKIPVEDPFLKKAVTLAADNRPPEVITSILSLEISAMEERHGTGIDMLDGMGADGPAFGMIGTLIGLVQMLQNMSDPSAIGPAMAVALLTTFYGAVIANVFTIPISIKLKQRSKAESTKMNIIVAGVLGIVAGENPRVIREKLDSFLPPTERQVQEDKE
ncbi:MAG TPA: MotA/TolQ/ExbB proton channel family protein [Bacteriovoracaceae bacterium]|nr:MotA/TolQ/ExbB proton channel family protein [Bacteriovoracaceae bacterium]